MTTAQRTKELVGTVLKSMGSEQRVLIMSASAGKEIAATLDQFSGMLEAALPDEIEFIAREHASNARTLEQLRKSGDCAHKDRATLLDAYRVLAAERDARLADVLHLRAEADRSLVAMNKEREQHASVFADYESARAEVDRLTDSLDANKRALLERAHVLDEVSEVWNPGDAWNDMRWDEIMRSMASGYLAMKQRADRLAEGISLYRRLVELKASIARPAVQGWEYTDGHLVER